MESTPGISELESSPPNAVPLPPWDMYTVAVGLFSGYILIPLLVSNILTLAAPLLQPAYEIFIQQAITLLSWICIFVFLGWRYRRNILPYLGLKPTRPVYYYLKESILVLSAMVALMLLVNLWVKSTGGVADKPYDKFSSTELKMISFFAVLMAPVLEEIIFRGFVQTTFHKISTPVRSVIFTCLLFLLFHGLYFDKLQALVYVFLLGLVLGYWRERTQSVIPGIAGHLFNNLLASWALFM